MGAICGKEKAQMAMLTSAHFPHQFVFSIHQSFDSIYEVVEVIGQGSTAKVSRIRRRETRTMKDRESTSLASDQSNSKSPVKYFALKEINVNMVKPEILDAFENEIRLLKGLVS